MSKQVVEKLVEALNTRNGATVAQRYTETATISGQSEEPLRGRKAIADNYDEYFRAFPDFNFELNSSMDSGELFCCEGTFRGTHNGPLATPDGDIEPTDRKVEVNVAAFFVVTAEGLIAEDRTYFDSAVMMGQLGIGE